MKMMKTTGKVTFLALALSAFSVVAYGADTGSSRSSGAVTSGQPAGSEATSGARSDWGTFETVDSNKDGFIDQQEAARVPGLGFMSYDADGDERLNRQEYETARSGGPALKGEGSGGSPIAPGTKGSEPSRSPSSTSPGTRY